MPQLSSFAKRDCREYDTVQDTVCQSLTQRLNSSERTGRHLHLGAVRESERDGQRYTYSFYECVHPAAGRSVQIKLVDSRYIGYAHRCIIPLLAEEGATGSTQPTELMSKGTLIVAQNAIKTVWDFEF